MPVDYAWLAINYFPAPVPAEKYLRVQVNWINHLGFDGGDCSVSRIDLPALEIEKTVSLRKYAEEIYEFLPVEETTNWPVYDHDNFYSLDEAWEQQYLISGA